MSGRSHSRNHDLQTIRMLADMKRSSVTAQPAPKSKCPNVVIRRRPGSEDVRIDKDARNRLRAEKAKTESLEDWAKRQSA